MQRHNKRKRVSGYGGVSFLHRPVNYRLFGSMFDFLLTKRPCVLYAPDLDNYKNSERGFYFDITETPFPIAVNADELYENVKAFDIEKYQDGVDRFLVKIENAENGRASEKAVDKILDHLRGKK